MNTYKRHRFPPEIISYAVWLYHRFNLSYRDVEDLLAERGITVSYETIRLWCIKFGARYDRRLRRRHHIARLVEAAEKVCERRANTVLRVAAHTILTRSGTQNGSGRGDHMQVVDV